MTDEHDLRDFYGSCTTEPAQPCVCRINGPWKGRACPNWKPLGPKNSAELLAWRRKQFAERRTR